MKKYTVLSALAFTCLTMKAAELDGVRYGGYTTNAVPAGFSIVAVPFSGVDTNSSSFSVTNLSLEALISTNGLALGDRLIAFNEATTNYYYYTLTSTGWDSVEVANIGTGSTNFVKIVSGVPLSTVTKAQGYAFWLKSTNVATTVYLQGVVNTNASVAVAAGPSFTLVGNALPTALNLNSESFTNNTWFFAGYPGRGDEIHVATTNGKYIKNVYYGGGWKKIEYTTSNTVYSAASDPIPAGSGMWYLRRGTSAQTLVIK